MKNKYHNILFKTNNITINMSNKSNGPEIHIDMSGIKMSAGDKNMSVGWDGVKVNGESIKLQTSMSGTMCINNKCKACIDNECFDFECNDKAKVKGNNVYCGDKKVFSKKN